MFEDVFLKFSSPDGTEKHSRLVVSRISNINSIQYVASKKESYLKFNLADGSTPTCLCPKKDLKHLKEIAAELQETMGPLARFDNPPGIFFNCKNVTSFYFMKQGNEYQLNMSYHKGVPDCFDVGSFSPEQFQKMPCSEFFEDNF